jgi:hypothetical protein
MAIRVSAHRIDVRIYNVSACADLHRTFDLASLVQQLHGAEYEPVGLGGRIFMLTYRDPKLHGTVELFANGKLQLLGAKSEADAYSDIQLVVHRLSRILHVRLRCDIHVKKSDAAAAGRSGKQEFVMFVYCRVCNHVFADSLDWQKNKDPESSSAFVCPVCGTRLWVK